MGSEVLNISLRQANHGSWYLSAMELQLVSLPVCVMCRSARTLIVRVHEASPRRLYHLGVHLQTSTRDAKVDADTREKSRVPKIDPLGLSWGVRVLNSMCFPVHLRRPHFGLVSTFL